MKLLSRPINWSLVLAPLLVSMLALPGNAHSRDNDRTTRQLEHRQRVRDVERPQRKAEEGVPTPQARRAAPIAVRTPDSGNRGPDRRQAAAPQRSDRGARVRDGRPARDASGPRRSAMAESLDRAQRSRAQSDSRHYRQSTRNSGYQGDNRGQGSQPAHARQRDGRHEQRIRHDQQRADRYYAAQARQREVAMQRTRALQQQRRANQYRYQNQYNQRLRQQHVSWNSGRYNYYNDPFYSTPASYRYQFGGQWHSTNRYGANLMQQAVDYGYQEGLRAGQADRYDGWRADYRDNYAYQDAGYGYNGRYISPGEYQHYFRQGFQRGYQDGYGNRYDYGYRRSDGSVAIIAAVLATIVGLQVLN